MEKYNAVYPCNGLLLGNKKWINHLYMQQHGWISKFCLVRKWRQMKKWVHVVWFHSYKILENENEFKVTADLWLPREGVGQGVEGGKEKLWRRRKTLGGNYLNCGDDFTGVFICQSLSKLFISNMCRFFVCQLYLSKVVRKRSQKERVRRKR